MKTTRNGKSASKAFTLIEMIGVLAVIAILASLLIPKIYEAINSSRINNAVLSYNTVKTALADHYAKFGSLNSANGVAFTVIPGPGSTNFDSILVSEGFLDKPFTAKIGDVNTHIEVVAAQPLTTTAPDANGNGAFDLDGTGAANDAIGSYVVEAVIPGVNLSDAFALSTLLDGPSLSNASAQAGTDDIKGRVIYKGTATTTVYIYVTHR